MTTLNLKKDFTDVYDELRRMYNPNRMTDKEKAVDMQTKRVVSIIMACASLVLTAFNIYCKYWLMAITTASMSVIFALCIPLSENIKNRQLVVLIMSLTLGFIFTYYAISGQNDGFAILWIMLVPLIGMLVLGVKAGTIISLYFLVLLVFLFYLPYKKYMHDYYTETFMARFPVLYLVDFVAATYVTMRKEYYKIITENMANTDLLTEIGNRRYYEEAMTRIEDTNDMEDLVIFVIDVNRLKYTNDKYGHTAGDNLLINAANYLKKTFNKSGDIISRNGGDEFAAISYMTKYEVESILEQLNQFKFEYNGKCVPGTSLSVGVAMANDNADLTVYELEKVADKSMYEAKEEFYRTSGVERRRA